MILSLIVPEIDYFADRRARNAALVFVMRNFAMTGIGGYVLGLIAVFVSVVIVDDFRFLGHSVSLVLLALFVVFVPTFTVLQGIVIAIFRGPVRRYLRRQFAGSRCLRCLICGYDLQGNVSGTCPECGTGCRHRDAR